MADPLQALGERFEQNLVIEASPATVFNCFFSPDALKVWWQAVRSVTTPVPFGVYAIEWATTLYRDDVLGALGGVFHGTVVDVKIGRQFYVADAWWVPPSGEPIGPMGLQITCQKDPAGCRLNVKQDGYEESPRWLRYYAVTARGWQVSLLALKRYAETARAGTGTTASTSSAGSTGPSGSPSPEASSGPSDSAGSPAPTDAATPEVEATVPAGPTAFERLMNSDNSND